METIILAAIAMWMVAVLAHAYWRVDQELAVQRALCEVAEGYTALGEAFQSFGVSCDEAARRLRDYSLALTQR